MKQEILDRWVTTIQSQLAAMSEESFDDMGIKPRPEKIIRDLSTTQEGFTAATHRLTLQSEKIMEWHDDLVADYQHYRGLFEFAPRGYITTDSVGIIGQANTAAADLLGVNQSSLKGQSLSAFIANGAPQQVCRSRMARFLRTPDAGSVAWETFIQCCNGCLLPAVVTMAAVRDAQGNMGSLIWRLRDITEQKQVQEIIQDITAEHQAMLENAFDGVLLIRDGKIIRCNHKLEEMLGYNRSELIGHSVGVLSMSQRETDDELMDMEIIERTPCEREMEIRRKDGTGAWCAVAGVLVDVSSPSKGSIWRLQNISQIKDAHVALESAHSELEERIRQRTGALSQANLALSSEIAERKRIEQALRESEARLRALSGHLQSVREEESAKIAREVHDELGGTLTVLKLGLSSILDKAKEPQSLRDKLMSMMTLTDSAIKSVKRISTSLRPAMLDTLGLITTIQWHVKEFSELTGIQYELHLPKYIRLSPERNTAVFRIMQEALTNIARHADATKVLIQVWKHKGRLLIEIEDNGKGIPNDALTKPKSFGIFGMHERIHYLGGGLSIRKAETEGTVVALTLPLEQMD